MNFLFYRKTKWKLDLLNIITIKYKTHTKTGSGLIVQVTREAQVGVEHVKPSDLQTKPKYLDYIS